MKSAVGWGLLMGGLAFGVDILLPGCIEPVVALLAAFLAGLLAVRRSHPQNKRIGAGRGLVAGLTSGVVISLSDVLITALLAFGYFNKDQIPWLKQPLIPNLNISPEVGLWALAVIFVCMGVIKWFFVVVGGLAGGTFFTPKQR
jgi:hypothetical protein